MVKKLFIFLIIIFLVVFNGFSAFATDTDILSKETLYEIKDNNYTLTTVDGDEITTSHIGNSVNIIVFFSASDNNCFLTLDDIENSEWIYEDRVKVVAAEISGRSSEELRDFRDYYGFDDIIFCSDTSDNQLSKIKDYFLKKTIGADNLVSPFTLIIDQSGVVRRAFTGYQKPDDLKTFVEELVVDPTETSSVKAATTQNSTIKITWEKADTQVDGYSVYRAESNDGEYKKIIDTTKISYEDTDVIVGKNYFYKVCSYILKDSVQVESKLSHSSFGKATLAAPTLKAEIASKGVRLKFNSIDGADGYRITRSLLKDRAYTSVEGATQLTQDNFIDTSAERGNIWYYKICAYKLIDGTMVYGKSSEAHEISW